jgi:sec-independent protein translocase protein TatA
MLGDLFDSPWKILIIAAVVLILFGSRKMPEAARSLGRSMRILKAEVRDLHEDDAAGGAQQGQPAQQQPAQQLTAATGVPATGVPVTAAEGVPVAQAAPVVAPAPAAAPPASVPVPEVQQDTRPA